MKEFNLEEAKLGNPVCTRDGRAARIICFDKKCFDTNIVALILENGIERISHHLLSGKIHDGVNNPNDLMMVTKVGYVVIYRIPGGDLVNEYIFQDEKIAEDIGKKKFGENFVRVLKIEY